MPTSAEQELDEEIQSLKGLMKAAIDEKAAAHTQETIEKTGKLEAGFAVALAAETEAKKQIEEEAASLRQELDKLKAETAHHQ